MRVPTECNDTVIGSGGPLERCLGELNFMGGEYIGFGG